MNDFDDPLDLLGDDGDGVIEMCLLEEEEQLKKGGGHKNSGCCIIFLTLGSSALLSIWSITRMFA